MTNDNDGNRRAFCKHRRSRGTSDTIVYHEGPVCCFVHNQRRHSGKTRSILRNLLLEFIRVSVFPRRRKAKLSRIDVSKHLRHIEMLTRHPLVGKMKFADFTDHMFHFIHTMLLFWIQPVARLANSINGVHQIPNATTATASIPMYNFAAVGSPSGVVSDGSSKLITRMSRK